MEIPIVRKGKTRGGLISQVSESERLEAMSRYERVLIDSGYRRVAGVDEAGRGPLAGPVVSAAVILPEAYRPEKLNDSKQLSAKVRERLFERLTREAVAWGVGICAADEIDDVNILNATYISMERALSVLCPQPDYLLIDALTLKTITIEQKAIIKGDALSLSIAAASVIAKVTRDRMMAIYDNLYPNYGFAKHKGYGTAGHMEKIKKFGLCPIHRATFCHIGNNVI